MISFIFLIKKVKIDFNWRNHCDKNQRNQFGLKEKEFVNAHKAGDVYVKLSNVKNWVEKHHL